MERRCDMAEIRRRFDEGKDDGGDEAKRKEERGGWAEALVLSAQHSVTRIIYLQEVVWELNPWFAGWLGFFPEQTLGWVGPT